MNILKTIEHKPICRRLDRNTHFTDMMCNFHFTRTIEVRKLNSKPDCKTLASLLEDDEWQCNIEYELHYPEGNHPIIIRYVIGIGIVITGYAMSEEDRKNYLAITEKGIYSDDDIEWAVLYENNSARYLPEGQSADYYIYDSFNGLFVYRKVLDVTWHCDIDGIFSKDISKEIEGPAVETEFDESEIEDDFDDCPF